MILLETVEASEDQKITKDVTHIVRIEYLGEVGTVFCGPETVGLLRDIELFSQQACRP